MFKLNNIKEVEEFNDHELVCVGFEKSSGLRSFITIHNTNLGPAVGGTRFWYYQTDEEALKDGLRLSRAMTYKCALAGVPYGGGKGVIVADKKYSYSKKQFLSYARNLNILNGSFFTGEDVGMGKAQLSLLEKKSKFIIGRQKVAGNPSPWAAMGVFYAILAGLKELYGSEEIGGRSFAIKGVGKVGGALCEYLYRRGGKVVVADINKERLKYIKKKFPRVEVISENIIHKQKVDVYAPCALGCEFDDYNVKQLRCDLVCGGANNQLTTSKEGTTLHKQGILYIPDYLANAGGLINVVAELDERGYSRKRVEGKIKEIRRTAREIINLSKKYKGPTSEVADKLAESIFTKGKK